MSRASTPPDFPYSTPIAINQATQMVATSDDNRLRIDILGSSQINMYRTRILESPPRIILDFTSMGESFLSKTLLLDRWGIKKIRIGYHPDIIRMVFDISSADIPQFSAGSQNNRLSLVFGDVMKIDKATSGVTPSFAKGHSAPDKAEPAEITDQLSNGIQEDIPAIPEEQLPRISRNPAPAESSLDGDISRILSSMTKDKADNQEDTMAFLKAAQAYYDHRWDEAVDDFTAFIKAFPSGTHIEIAYFLLAQSYGKLYAEDIAHHFELIKRHYEDAMYRFPESAYLPEALFSIGKLCETNMYYNEALGYYNLVAEKKKGKSIGLQSIMRKVSILLKKEKTEEALSLLLDLLKRYPDSPMATEANIELAKVYFEMNSFSQSMEILNRLKSELSEDVYRHPDILQYLGYNYYQLGNYKDAREYLLCAYNIDPKGKDNHLILAKIADAYRDSGLPKQATKYYQLVVNRYPTEEGALISLTRLAEQQESGTLLIDRNDVTPLQLVDKTIDIPQKIYEDVLDRLLKQDDKNPLIQLAMLRLALLYQKDGRYEESYQLMKDLMKKYPRARTTDETLHAMKSIMGALLTKKMQEKKYVNVINTYHREKVLIDHLGSPYLFLIVARAFDYLKLKDMAVEMYRNADLLLQDKEKSIDLLFYLSQDEIERQDYTAALNRLDILINNYSSEKDISQAFEMKGQIYLTQREFMKAANMFSEALSFPKRVEIKLPLLLDKAKALIGAEQSELAVGTLQEASRMLRLVNVGIFDLALEIGNLYRDLGYPEDAIAQYKYALGIEYEKNNKIRLQMAIAECYEDLKQTKDYLALYQEISNQNDSFWSHLAKERMDAHNFTDILEQTE